MKKLRFLLIVALIGIATAAKADLRFGVKAGLDVSALHFDKSTFDSDNRAGFTAGIMGEFTVPVIGIGCDLSVMYVRRNSKWMEENFSDAATEMKNDYIEIPLNLKYKFGFLGIGKIIAPFITTGPSVAFLTSRTAINDFAKNKTCDFAWNFGAGVQLFNKVQIAASYGLGLSKAIEVIDKNINTTNINGKNRYWTITAAYLF